jgi:hypothetical protein
MWFLHVFGDNVEDAFGHARYLAFYLLSGIAASVIHILAVLNSADIKAQTSPTIGASGAISGVLGAYLVLYPKSRILTLIPIGWIIIVPISAIFYLGYWILLQFLNGMLFLRGFPTGIAYWAHIGGFIAGLLFGLIWRKRRLEYGF